MLKAATQIHIPLKATQILIKCNSNPILWMYHDCRSRLVFAIQEIRVWAIWISLLNFTESTSCLITPSPQNQVLLKYFPSSSTAGYSPYTCKTLRPRSLLLIKQKQQRSCPLEEEQNTFRGLDPSMLQSCSGGLLPPGKALLPVFNMNCSLLLSF